MKSSPTSLVFTVRRCEPELIPPAKPTPHEFKPLSDIDDQEILRFHVPIINCYKYDPSFQMQGRDPVGVIRAALAKALVFYYPFAGRLREQLGRKLVVECTGEGIMFIEADADVTLAEFNAHAPNPPFPCIEELLYDVPGSEGVLNCPLILIQVTRLKCGGFIFGLRLNHTMSDGFGLFRFMTAVSELIHGASTPSVMPVWQRTLLSARDSPRVTCIHQEYGKVGDCYIPFKDATICSFFFGPSEISTLRRLVPMHLRKCSNFDIIAAVVWRCRTCALQLNPSEVATLSCIVNARLKLNLGLPRGYYGNAFAFPAAVATAGDLYRNPLRYALEVVRKAKAKVNAEYFRSMLDFLVITMRPPLKLERSFVISDLTRTRFRDVDFGWGKATFGGPSMTGEGVHPQMVSFCFSSKNHKEEDGIVVPICLPRLAMEIFDKELNGFLKDHDIGVRSSL